MRRKAMKRSLSLLMTLVMVVSLLVAPAEATPSDEVVLSGPITTETTSAAVTVTGCEEYIGGRLILTTGPASQTDTDSRRQIANIKLTGTGAITVEFNPGAVLTQGETVLVHLYKYDSAADRFMNKLGNHVEITAPGAVPEVKPGTTPEEILANCSVTILKDGQKRTEPFLVNETSATVRVQLDPGVEQCYLTLFAYASNTAFDPDASHNMRLGSQFVKNGDEVTIKIAEGALKVGYSVIACLNVPVGPDWYKPVNSQAVKIVDESGQGFEDYDPYPNAFINDATLEAGATSMHISLEADARLFQAAKEGKTSLNVAVRQYPDGSDFDFEAEDQVTVYNAHLVTDPIVNQKITLTEPLKAGYRVRAVVYWEQNVSLHLPKGNDYEAMFHRPDDSVLISGEAVKPEPEAPTAAITGPVTPSSKNIVVTTTGEIPAGSRVLVKAYGDNDAILLAQGTLVGAADAAASVTLTPAADSLKTGSKLVAFVLNQGKLLAQSAPVFVGKDAPAGQGTITLNETITVDTKSATVTVAGYDEFKGGRLIVTIGNSVYDDRQLANVAFTGEGTYTVNFSPAYTLREGDQILPFLYLSGDPTRYQPGTVSVVGSSAPAPVELSTAIQGAVTTASKSITVKTTGEIPAGSRVLVKAYGAADEIALAKGTLIGSVDAAASVTLTPAAGALKAGEKLVAFLVKTGEILAQSQPATVAGEVTPPVASVTVTITDKVITQGDTKVNASASWDKSLGNQAQYVLYQFTGETLDTATAAKLSEGKIYRSYPNMTMNVHDLVVGSKLQLVLTIGGQTAVSNIITVEPSPDWGTPTVALDVASVSADAVAIPVHVQYDERYLTLGDDFYCDITLYQIPGNITDNDFKENEWWENSSIATRIGQINSRLGDETMGHVSVPVLKGVKLIPGSKIIAKLRLPHTEWEDQEVDYVSLSVPVLEAGESLPQPMAALLNLGADTQRGQQVREILTKLNIQVKTLENKDLDEKVGYVAGLPGYEETPGDFTGHHYTTEFMLLGNLSETLLDQLLAAMQEQKLYIGHKAMVVDGNKDASIHELLEVIVDEHNEMMHFQLTEKVKKAKALDEKEYGQHADWQKLQDSIASAEQLLNREKAETEALEKALGELDALYNAVVKNEKPDPTPLPGGGSSSGGTSRPAVNPNPQQPELPFADVEASDYYYDAVQWAVKNGVASGKTADSFAPDASCTRAQAVTFLWRAAGAPAPAKRVNGFTDVTAGSYYADAVQWAVEQGITKGMTETTFAPNATCTRAQIVAFLWRSEGGQASGTSNSFVDVSADAYYADAVQWAAENGVTEGKTENTFAPDELCTRAQIVTFLYRACTK